MNRFPQRLGALILATLLLVPLATPPAQAQTPVTDALHIVTNLVYHILHYAQRAQSVYNQYAQIRHQIESIAHQVSALRKMDGIPWREIANLLFMMDSLLERAGSLSYTLDNLDTVLREVFPGWSPAGTDWREKRTARVDKVLATFRGVLNSAGRGSTLISDQYKLWDIKERFNSLEGTQQALEGLGAFLSYMAEEQILQRQAAYAANNAAVVAQAEIVNRRAEDEATFLDIGRRTAQPPARQPTTFTFMPAGWAF